MKLLGGAVGVIWGHSCLSPPTFSHRTKSNKRSNPSCLCSGRARKSFSHYWDWRKTEVKDTKQQTPQRRFVVLLTSFFLFSLNSVTVRCRLRYFLASTYTTESNNLVFLFVLFCLFFFIMENFHFSLQNTTC